MSVQPIGDTIALVTLAWNIYFKGYAVARDAPQEFQELLDDLLQVKRILWHIHKKVERDVNSNDEFSRKILPPLLRRCFLTLYKIEALVAKYEKLGEDQVS